MSDCILILMQYYLVRLILNKIIEKIIEDHDAKAKGRGSLIISMSAFSK